MAGRHSAVVKYRPGSLLPKPTDRVWPGSAVRSHRAPSRGLFGRGGSYTGKHRPTFMGMLSGRQFHYRKPGAPGVFPGRLDMWQSPRTTYRSSAARGTVYRSSSSGIFRLFGDAT